MNSNHLSELRDFYTFGRIVNPLRSIELILSKDKNMSREAKLKFIERVKNMLFLSEYSAEEILIVLEETQNH